MASDELKNTRAHKDEAYWAQVRAQFLFEPGFIYLNNASVGIPPKPVVDAVARGYERLSENLPAGKGELYGYIDEIVRPALATLVGADSEEIAFTRNASEALHLIAHGIDLKPGDEVVTTTQEHPAGITPWLLRAERSGIVVRQVFIPSPFTSESQVIDLLSREMSSRTKVVFFCHITRGGHLYPMKALCALAAERGILSAVDGAQAVGMMDVNLHDLGCDFYANSLHKWVLAPIGNGFLYVRQAVQDRFLSWYTSSGAGPTNASRYEAPGTYDLPVRAGIGAALDFLNRIGITHIEARDRMLSDYLKVELMKVPRVRLCSSLSRRISSPGSTIFEIEGMQASTLPPRFLKQENITVDDHTRDGHSGIRVSTHYYNTTEQIDRFIAVLKKGIAD